MFSLCSLMLFRQLLHMALLAPVICCLDLMNKMKHCINCQQHTQTQCWWVMPPPCRLVNLVWWNHEKLLWLASIAVNNRLQISALFCSEAFVGVIAGIVVTESVWGPLLGLWTATLPPIEWIFNTNYHVSNDDLSTVHVYKGANQWIRTSSNKLPVATNLLQSQKLSRMQECNAMHMPM